MLRSVLIEGRESLCVNIGIQLRWAEQKDSLVIFYIIDQDNSVEEKIIYCCRINRLYCCRINRLYYDIVLFSEHDSWGGYHDYCFHFKEKKFDFKVSNVFTVLSYVLCIKKYIFNKCDVPIMCHPALCAGDMAYTVFYISTVSVWIPLIKE